MIRNSGGSLRGSDMRGRSSYEGREKKLNFCLNGQFIRRKNDL